MYKFSYNESLDDAPDLQKHSEKQAIEYSIMLLRQAQAKGNRSRETIDAIAFVNRLWSFLIEQLSDPENRLPVEIKANLISIGLWLMREGEAIADQKSENFKGLIEVSQSVAEGLK